MVDIMKNVQASLINEIDLCSQIPKKDKKHHESGPYNYFPILMKA